MQEFHQNSLRTNFLTESLTTNPVNGITSSRHETKPLLGKHDCEAKKYLTTTSSTQNKPGNCQPGLTFASIGRLHKEASYLHTGGKYSYWLLDLASQMWYGRHLGFQDFLRFIFEKSQMTPYHVSLLQEKQKFRGIQEHSC